LHLMTCTGDLQAANYLNIEPLLDLACATVAGMIKGKTPEEIRTQFNITVSFSYPPPSPPPPLMATWADAGAIRSSGD